MKQPNGFFIKDMINFGDLNSNGYMSKGFIVQVKDHRKNKNIIKNEIHVLNQLFLRSFGPDIRVQFNWSVDSDFSEFLDHYGSDTKKLAKHPWTIHVRNEREDRYRDFMKKRFLRIERLHVYVTVKIKHKAPLNSEEETLEEYYESLLEYYTKFFESQYMQLVNIYSGIGGKIKAMTDRDHFEHYNKFLNPSYADYEVEYNLNHYFDTEKEEIDSIQYLCWHSGFRGNKNKTMGNEYSFYMDGYYHEILCLKIMPGQTSPGIIEKLTNLLLLDYSITVNIHPIEISKEKRETEKLIGRLRGDMNAEGRYSLEASIDKAGVRLYEISSGEAVPYKIEFILRAWSRDKDELRNKVELINTTIKDMHSAQCWDIGKGTTAKQLWYKTWPGWLYSTYTGYEIKDDDRKIADMLPLSGTFTAHLDIAEAIYDGEFYNLVGIVTSISGAVQSTGFFGASRMGKSATAIDFLTQTECFYDFTAIIEEGLSYGVMTKIYGETPIIFSPNSKYIINYFDTDSLPVTPMQINDASGILIRMGGLTSDESVNKKRGAILSQHINMIYEDHFNVWKFEHEEEIPDIVRFILAVESYQRDEMSESEPWLHAWVEFKNTKETNPTLYNGYMDSVTEDAITEYLVTKEVELRNNAYGFFKTEDYPTHSSFLELIQSSAADHNADSDLKDLAISLSEWCSDGAYGCLFDGHTNVKLNKRIVHFELGQISESSKELKAIVVFLIKNHIRNHILSMPRKLRKRIIFEEMSRLLEVKGGDEVIAEAYAQLAKTNTHITSIVQQYAQFQNHAIRPVIIGNSRQYMIMKQKYPGDLEDLRKDIIMSENAKQFIMQYRSPDNKDWVGERYASFMYHYDDYPAPSYGTVRNICSPEMLYVSSSNPELYDLRAKQLKNEKDLIKAIMKYSREEGVI